MKMKLRWIVIILLLVGLGFVLVKTLNKGEEVPVETEGLEEGTQLEIVPTETPIPVDENAPCIVVDAGHGGYDPGMVNENGVIEKEINLQMAYVLKACLEQSGFRVILTRTDDNGLYEDGTSGRKMQDLQKRCQIINDAQPVCTISLHQNSFPDETVYGPQVFYYHTSEGSKGLAEVIQGHLNEKLQVEKPREAKDNGSYYILKRSPSVIALVECGFLSNAEEAALLVTEEYQKQLAQAICDGLKDWIEQEKSDSQDLS